MRKQQVFLPSSELQAIEKSGARFTKAGKPKKPNLRKLVSAKRQANYAELTTERRFTLIVVESRVEDDGTTPVLTKPRMFMVPMLGRYADVAGNESGATLLKVARDNCPYPTSPTVAGFFRFHTPTLAVRLRTPEDDEIFYAAGNTGMVTVSNDKMKETLQALGLTLSGLNALDEESLARLEVNAPLTPEEKALVLPIVVSDEGTEEERIAKAAKMIQAKREQAAAVNVKSFPV